MTCKKLSSVLDLVKNQQSAVLHALCTLQDSTFWFFDKQRERKIVCTRGVLIKSFIKVYTMYIRKEKRHHGNNN